ncbi:DUF4240 domain-containing protein [Actinomadura sp. NPDC048394]|uniref:DUF4240 domain-containing protein n=1 Tax=Actinomadura sp. NPDC048394 TaxID=3158223 RepID=UPI0033C3D917
MHPAHRRPRHTRLRSDTYALWGAAYLIMDGLCSMDAFWYFQPWLIGHGRRLRAPHRR